MNPTTYKPAAMNKPVESMMAAVASALEANLLKNGRIILASADLSTSCKIDRVVRAFPANFIDFGIAEQNMVSVCAGLAHEGWLPFLFTFGVFATLRAAEQVRTDVFYNRVPVVVVGTHSGVSTGPAGCTHYAIEDIAVARSFAGSTVIVPSDSVSAEWAANMLVEAPRPCYLRLDRNPLPRVHDTSETLEIGKAARIREGEDIAILACGSCVSDSRIAAETLDRDHGISASVWDFHTVKPIDTDVVGSLAGSCDLIVTVEEHTRIGGLGGAVSEVLAGMDGAKLVRLGIDDQFPHGGPVQAVRSRLGIDADGIVASVLRNVRSAQIS